MTWFSGKTISTPNLLSFFLVEMLMPKKQTREIYEYLFNEGVLVAKKDVHLAKHPQIPSIPNLHVMKCLLVRVSVFYNVFLEV
jgi:hypothetical protein